MNTQSRKSSREDLLLAGEIWHDLSELQAKQLTALIEQHKLSLSTGDLLLLNGGWYVTHCGLLRLANRNRCRGIHVQPVGEFCNASAGRWAFRATVYRSSTCKGFVGYGDADPSNVSPLVQGAEMRIAETRAVNRALRKAYGIGICSVEEIGSAAGLPARIAEKRPPQSTSGNGSNSHNRLRDRLCQVIRQHQLDPIQVKAYAVDFCGVKSLKEASREQVAKFVNHISDWAAKDKNALVCQLNSYLGQKEGAA